MDKFIEKFDDTFISFFGINPESTTGFLLMIWVSIVCIGLSQLSSVAREKIKEKNKKM